MLLDCMLGLDNDKDCKSIAVYLHIKHDEDSIPANDTTNWLIGYVAVGGKTRWDSLDHCIGKLFTEYLRQVDQQSHLGLDEECLSFYRVGEIERSLNADDEAATPPELLPCGYLVGDCNSIGLIVKQNTNYDLPSCLALDTLIPLPILSRLVRFVGLFVSCYKFLTPSHCFIDMSRYWTNTVESFFADLRVRANLTLLVNSPTFASAGTRNRPLHQLPH